jgi:cytochrome o ubiquinol oxidase subunit 3
MENKNDKTIFGFWLYLMTDLVMFAALFATYAVLRSNSFGGPTEANTFNIYFVFAETLILLTSSFTVGMASVAAAQNNVKKTIGWFSVTFALGLAFLSMEITEFSRLIKAGSGPQRSAFLSSYFALVGAHGLHIAVGLLWMGVTMAVISRRGLTPKTNSQLQRLALFWHFLDIVWIFIFTVVYLMGIM